MRDPVALIPPDPDADTVRVIGRRMCLAAAVVALVALTGGCSPEKSRFCSHLSRIDKALAPLREAKGEDEFEKVRALVDAVADAYEGVEPPPALQQDWRTAIQFFRQQGEAARIILQGARAPATSADEDARNGRAFTNITDYGVAHCGRVRGQLVP